MTKEKENTEAVVVQQSLQTSPMGIATDAMLAEAQRLVDSKLLPETIKKPEQALVIIQAGKELGFPPMASFSNIYVVGGRPSLSGQGVAALLRKSGVKYKIVKDLEPVYGGQDGKQVVDNITTIHFITPDGMENDVSYRWSDAIRAGYATRDTWKKFPSEMMFWRCLTKGARRVAPDALMGLYEVSELADNGLASNVDYTEEGEVIVIEDNSKI